MPDRDAAKRPESAENPANFGESLMRSMEKSSPFAPRREINSEQRAVLNYYCRTHRGLVPDAIEALMWSHDAILGLAQGLVEAETGADVEAFEQELRAYVDPELERKCAP